MHLVSIRTTCFTQQKRWGLYQNKVNSSLAVIERPGHWADNCKMVYYERFSIRSIMKCYKLNFLLIRKKGGNNIPATRCQLRDLVVSEYLQQQGICYIFLIFFGGDSSVSLRTILKSFDSVSNVLHHYKKPWRIIGNLKWGLRVGA